MDEILDKMPDKILEKIMGKKALVLFAHGARDPRWARPFERLRDKLAAQLPATDVHLAFLEFMQPPLPQLAGDLAAQGVEAFHIVPVFLGQGGHVLRDLPLILDDLRTAYPAVHFSVAEAVGESDAVLDAIAGYCIAGYSN